MSSNKSIYRSVEHNRENTRVLRKLLFAFVLVKFYHSLILQEKTLHCKYVHKHRTSSACSNFFAPVTSGISTVFDRIRNSSDK